MRKICRLCETDKDSEDCQKCSWINTRLPTNYSGRKSFAKGELKTLEEPA